LGFFHGKIAIGIDGILPGNMMIAHELFGGIWGYFFGQTITNQKSNGPPE